MGFGLTEFLGLLLIIFAAIFSVINFVSWKSFKLKLPTEIVMMLSTGAAVATVVLIIAGAIYSDWCNDHDYAAAVFNAHLKNLCVERSDKSECPKTEAELAAFNPKLYAYMERCKDYKYYFNFVSQEYTWVTRVSKWPEPALQIHHPKLYPFGYGIFRFPPDEEGEEKKSNNSKPFPPQFDGPWEQVEKDF